MIKTNVIRLLTAAGVAHVVLEYPVLEEEFSGEHTASLLGLPPEKVFKTLVLQGEKAGIFVCCIPCHEEIDLRKAARAAREKKCEMLPTKALLAATGYIRGGVSPVGMKKKYPIFVEETALLQEAIAVSAGLRGAMAMLAPEALIAYTEAVVADLIKASMGYYSGIEKSEEMHERFFRSARSWNEA